MLVAQLPYLLVSASCPLAVLSETLRYLEPSLGGESGLAHYLYSTGVRKPNHIWVFTNTHGVIAEIVVSGRADHIDQRL